MSGTPSGQATIEPDPTSSGQTSVDSKVARSKSGKASWVRRVIGVLITLAIFAWIFKPVVLHWNEVRDRIHHTNVSRVFFASLMFAVFLFVFRASTWRRILIGFGYRLPVAPTVRIWSSSELSRYLPGVIWQVVSRIYLVKPYGVRGSVCSASQILELALFLLANVLLAVGCLTWLGHKMLPQTAQNWLFGAIGLIPVLMFLLHPRVFYGLTNAVMRQLGKPEIVKKLRFGELVGLLLWNVLGLVWQSLAIWLVVSTPLGLQFTKWWVVAGAYSLAWCAGFLAFWAPGGIGVRELVFVMAMEIALPGRVKATFNDPAVQFGFLAFLSVLLRLWATTGELILAGVAYVADYRGALGRVDAPGRVAVGQIADD